MATMVGSAKKELSGTIRCSRCTGLMVAEESFDSSAGGTQAGSLARRCVQCGEVVDPVILANRCLKLGIDPGRTFEEGLR
ncbi:hypothetical protein [Candidatus Nitrospira nitrificans]|uniref:Uncharacterized protein n=1 Tax=Candidatus Nitrospira nitrificans TaxID=1742973 RepID=A0A0S4L4E9_9BACT|nr:hypothetical protein [Candidatus Nitrospira nitrificans]CUS32561.1 hypothetical protein COMA2_100183 [Candidatus Nitrospira nitrificans]